MVEFTRVRLMARLSVVCIFSRLYPYQNGRTPWLYYLATQIMPIIDKYPASLTDRISFDLILNRL